MTTNTTLTVQQTIDIFSSQQSDLIVAFIDVVSDSGDGSTTRRSRQIQLQKKNNYFLNNVDTNQKKSEIYNRIEHFDHLCVSQVRRCGEYQHVVAQRSDVGFDGLSVALNDQ